MIGSNINSKHPMIESNLQGFALLQAFYLRGDSLQCFAQNDSIAAHKNHRVVPILPSMTLGLQRFPRRSSRPSRPATRSE